MSVYIQVMCMLNRRNKSCQEPAPLLPAAAWTLTRPLVPKRDLATECQHHAHDVQGGCTPANAVVNCCHGEFVAPCRLCAPRDCVPITSHQEQPSIPTSQGSSQHEGHPKFALAGTAKHSVCSTGTDLQERDACMHSGRRTNQDNSNTALESIVQRSEGTT